MTDERPLVCADADCGGEIGADDVVAVGECGEIFHPGCAPTYPPYATKET